MYTFAGRGFIFRAPDPYFLGGSFPYSHPMGGSSSWEHVIGRAGLSRWSRSLPASYLLWFFDLQSQYLDNRGIFTPGLTQRIKNYPVCNFFTHFFMLQICKHTGQDVPGSGGYISSPYSRLIQNRFAIWWRFSDRNVMAYLMGGKLIYFLTITCLY